MKIINRLSETVIRYSILARRQKLDWQQEKKQTQLGSTVIKVSFCDENFSADNYQLGDGVSDREMNG